MYINFKPNKLEKNKPYSITLTNSKLNNKLSNYLNSQYYEVSISQTYKNTVYGDIHDTSKNNNLFTTKYIFKYNFETDDFKIYDFNSNYRLLYYYILNNTIYASLIIKNPSNEISYNWSIIKFDNSLNNGIILKEGTVTNPISSPIFHYSETQKNYMSSL